MSLRRASRLLWFQKYIYKKQEKYHLTQIENRSLDNVRSKCQEDKNWRRTEALKSSLGGCGQAGLHGPWSAVWHSLDSNPIGNQEHEN